MPTPLSGVPWTTGDVDDMTADIEARNDDAEAEAGGISEADLDAAVAALVDSAPGSLDTLNELANALGDDASFASTVTASLATKAPLLNVPVVVSGTTDTLAAGDSGKVNRYTNASAVVVTIPTDASDDLPDGFTCTLVAEGAGGLSLSVSGITVTGSALTAIAQGEALVVVKTATANTWIVLGGTA